MKGDTVIVKGTEYVWFYTSENGDFYVPKVVVNGAEPWLKITKAGEKFLLFNGLWRRV